MEKYIIKSTGVNTIYVSFSNGSVMAASSNLMEAKEFKFYKEAIDFKNQLGHGWEIETIKN